MRPIHALILAIFLWFGCFTNSSVVSFIYSAAMRQRSGPRFGTMPRIAPFICVRCTGFMWSITEFT